jgi:uncharacterized protein (DUF58 family)
MGTRALTDLGVSEAEIFRLRRLADRLLTGSPTRPHGTSPRKLRAGRGLEFFELRPYQAGDEARQVDWRATARSSQPVVRRYQDEALSTVILCLDRSASMNTDRGAKWGLARQLAAALGYLLSYGGHAVGLLAFSADLDVIAPPARGRSSHVRLLARLARTEARESGGASRLAVCAGFVKPGNSVIVLSDCLAPDFMRSGLDQLLHRGGRVHVFQLLSPAELDISGAETAVLRDAETGERRTLRLTGAVRDAAASKLNELRNGLESYCRKNGIRLTACASPATWRDLVLRHTRALGHG